MYRLATLLLRSSTKEGTNPSPSFIATLLEGSNILLSYSIYNRGQVLVLSKKRLRRLIYKTILKINNYASSEIIRRLCKHGDCDVKGHRKATVVIRNYEVYQVSITTLRDALKLLQKLEDRTVSTYKIFISLSLALLSLSLSCAS